VFEVISKNWFIAQTDVFRNLGASFRGRAAHFSSTDLLTIILVLAALAVGTYILSRLLQRQELPQRSNSPRVLFRELCLAHGLDRSSRGLLRQIGRYQRLDHLGRLFLEPERLDPANLSPKLRQHQALLLALRQKLFSDLTLNERAKSNEADDKQPRRLAVEKPTKARISIAPIVSSDGALTTDKSADVS